MRIRITALVATSLSALLAPTAWSQDDPFGDPFSAPQQTTKQKETKSVQVQPTHAVEHDASGHEAEASPDGLQPIYVAIVNQKETEEWIHASLKNETTNVFIDTPLEEALSTIATNHKISIVLDARALEEVGLTTDTPVNIALKNVSLRSFLRLMLRELELTYMIKDEVLQITTIEAAEQNLNTQMYRLPGNLVANSDKVLAALQSAVVPGTWDTHGGPSVATSIDHVLIVSTTSDAHHHVEDFLNTLIETYGE